MRDRKSSPTLASLVRTFTKGDRSKIHRCTIDRFCCTKIYEFSGAVLEAKAQTSDFVIYETEYFRATIDEDPKALLSRSAFSPHYSACCSLRKRVDELTPRVGNISGNGHVNLFVVMEEFREIEATSMHQGECILIDQGILIGGAAGNNEILALRSSDGAWPHESVDTLSENIVLAAIKTEHELTHGMKAIVDVGEYMESSGRIVHIQEAYIDFKFGGLRSLRKLDAQALRVTANRISRFIDVLGRMTKHDEMLELINALRLKDASDRQYLSLWYLRLLQAADDAGHLIGERQFRNPKEGSDAQERRREQIDHRNAIAHGKVDEIDYGILVHLQQDVLKLLRKELVRESKSSEDG